MVFYNTAYFGILFDFYSGSLYRILTKKDKLFLKFKSKERIILNKEYCSQEQYVKVFEFGFFIKFMSSSTGYLSAKIITFYND